MNKNGKNIELKIYEALGIKTFRKMAFGLYKMVAFPFTIFMSKEERKDFYNMPNNYNMKKGHGLQDLRDFKKWLLVNACIHIWVLYNCMPAFLNVVSGTASLSTTIFNLSAVGINCYCIMLQRYNHIRINQVIKKMEPREEAKKSELKEELIKEDSLLNEHTYKVVNKRDKEKDITFEELLETATYEQLKQYCDYLSYFKAINQMIEEQQSYYSSEKQSTISVPLQKNKTLKLELKPKKQNERAN